MSMELNKESVEQAVGDERVIGWRERILAAHPNSDPGFWPDALLVEHMAAEIADLRAALAQPSPVRSSLLINGYQLRAALDFIAPDGTAEQLESEACIEWRQQDADFLEAGLYAFCAEYPEEGGVLLDEEPTAAQPSPLQSEQAEAERPEVVAYADPVAFATFKERGHEGGVAGREWMWAEPGAALVAMSRTDECDRIVGALRAERDGAIKLLGQSVWQKIERLTQERDAALARIEQQERTIAGMNEAHAKLAGLYEAAQAQHSVPDHAELLQALERTHAGHMVGHDQSDQPKGGYSDGYVNGFGECIKVARKVLAASPVCRLSRSALTDAQMRRLYDSSTETENERLGFAAFARLIRRAEAVHQIAAAPGKEGV
ncbi:hypothetical protein ABLT12_30090 [Pseudomonas aeruginosa]|uniref:hypothetical protein n=1 Tax=Pseudomonas aeruginosa TaxID=287 RepID=UPI0032B3B9B3